NQDSNTVSVFFGQQGGGFVAPVSLNTWQAPRALTIGDLNGDALPDLAVANFGSDNVSVFYGQTGGTFDDAGTFSTGRLGPVGVAAVPTAPDGVTKLHVIFQADKEMTCQAADKKGLKFEFNYDGVAMAFRPFIKKAVEGDDGQGGAVKVWKDQFNLKDN